jgi:hypothetical protein
VNFINDDGEILKIRNISKNFEIYSFSEIASDFLQNSVKVKYLKNKISKTIKNFHMATRMMKSENR